VGGLEVVHLGILGVDVEKGGLALIELIAVEGFLLKDLQSLVDHLRLRVSGF
jgi:hypothetical protein